MHPSVQDVRPSPAAVAVAVVVVATAVFDPWGYAPFGPLKWLLVSTAVLAAGAVALRRRVRIHRGSAIGVGVFLAWGVVVSLTAADPLHTWIGTPDRHFGLATVGLLAIAYFVGQQLTSLADRRTVVRAVVVAAAACALYGVVEWLGVEPVTVSGGTDRLGGPFGTAAYLGAALTLMLPAAVAAAADPAERLAWRIGAGTVAVVGLAVAVGTGTRAAWIGLAVAAAVSAPRWWRWLLGRRWVAVAAAGVVVVVLVTTPVLERTGSAVDFDDGGAAGRVAEWSVGVDALLDAPVLGYGYEGYRTAFPSHVTADYARSYGREVVADRAHNGLLDIGLAAGIPGLLMAAAAGGWLLVLAWRAVRKGDTLLVGIAAAATGYLAQQMFLFPIAEIEPVFWVLAGVLVASMASGHRTEFGPSRVGMALLATLAVVALGVGLLDVAADRRTDAAIDAASEGSVEVARRHTEVAEGLRPDSIRYAVVAASIENADGTAAGAERALETIDHAIAISPADPILLRRRAEILLDLAQRSGDPVDLDHATVAWQERVDADPNHADHRLQLGVALALGSDVDGAETQWLAAADLAPQSVAPLTNLALLYVRTGRDDEAEPVIAAGLLIDPTNTTLLDLMRGTETGSS